jgi:hypothetical protein
MYDLFVFRVGMDARYYVHVASTIPTVVIHSLSVKARYNTHSMEFRVVRGGILGHIGHLKEIV